MKKKEKIGIIVGVSLIVLGQTLSIIFTLLWA